MEVYELIELLEITDELKTDEIHNRIFDYWREQYDGQTPDIIIEDIADSWMPSVLDYLKENY